MRSSLRGHLLPESSNEAQKLRVDGAMLFQTCMECKKDLADPDAATTPAGWRETQISGMCESCFDELFNEGDEA